MTTIVATRTEIVSDLQFTNSQVGTKFKGKQKIFKFDSIPIMNLEYPAYIGLAGTASDILEVVDFYSSTTPVKPPRVSGVQGLVLSKKGELFFFDQFKVWMQVQQPYYAIGSGAPYALGAIESGKTLKEAIKVAMKHDAFTGMGVVSHSF